MSNTRPTTRFMGAAHVRVPSPATASEKGSKATRPRKGKKAQTPVSDDEGTESEVPAPKASKKGKKGKKAPDSQASSDASEAEPAAPKKRAAAGKKKQAGTKKVTKDGVTPAAGSANEAPSSTTTEQLSAGKGTAAPPSPPSPPSPARSYARALSPDGKASTIPVRFKPRMVAEVVIPLRSLPSAAALEAQAPAGQGSNPGQAATRTPRPLKVVAAAKGEDQSLPSLASRFLRSAERMFDVLEPLQHKLRRTPEGSPYGGSQPSDDMGMDIDVDEDDTSDIDPKILINARRGPPRHALPKATTGPNTVESSSRPVAHAAVQRRAPTPARSPISIPSPTPSERLREELFPTPHRPRVNPSHRSSASNAEPDRPANDFVDLTTPTPPLTQQAPTKRRRDYSPSDNRDPSESPNATPVPKKKRARSTGKAPETQHKLNSTSRDVEDASKMKTGKLSTTERIEFAKERDRILAFCHEKGRRPETVLKAMGFGHRSKKGGAPHSWNMYCMWRRLQGKPTSAAFVAGWSEDYRAELDSITDEDGAVDPAALESWLEEMRMDLEAAGKLDEAESDPVKRMTDTVEEQRELCNTLAHSEDIFVLSLIFSVDEVASQLNSIVTSSDHLRSVVELSPERIKKVIGSIAAVAKNLQNGVIEADAIDLSGLLPIGIKGTTNLSDSTGPTATKARSKAVAEDSQGKSKAKSSYPKPGDLRQRSQEFPHGDFWTQPTASRAIRDWRRRTFRWKTICDLALAANVASLAYPWDRFPHILITYKLCCRDWPLLARLPGIDWNASSIQVGVSDDIQVAVGAAWQRDDHSEGAHPFFEAWTKEESEIAIDDPRYLDIPIIYSWDPAARADVVRLTIRSSRSDCRAHTDEVTKVTMADEPPIARVRASRVMAEKEAQGPRVPSGRVIPVALPRKPAPAALPTAAAPTPLPTETQSSLEQLKAAVNAVRKPKPNPVRRQLAPPPEVPTQPGVPRPHQPHTAAPTSRALSLRPINESQLASPHCQEPLIHHPPSHSLVAVPRTLSTAGSDLRISRNHPQIPDNRSTSVQSLYHAATLNAIASSSHSHHYANAPSTSHSSGRFLDVNDEYDLDEQDDYSY